MNRHLLALVLSAVTLPLLRAAGPVPEPDYGEWNRLLATYYDPAKGMDYAGLKARELPAMSRLRGRLAVVDPDALERNQRLAYWINVYNLNTVAIAAEAYPIRSIKDLSRGWNPYQIFGQPRVRARDRDLSLKEIEDDRLRAGFADARVHFAINCASRSCPPLRGEAYTGARIDVQLDEQAAAFLSGPNGVRLSETGEALRIEVSPILDWYRADFQREAGGVTGFLSRHLPLNLRARLLAPGEKPRFVYRDYDWTLNDWRRVANRAGA